MITRRRLPAWSLSVALTLLALALRLPSWGNSLFGDEVGSFFIVQDHTFGGIVHLLDGHSVDLTPPLYYLLSRAARAVVAGPEGLRVAPLLAGTLAVSLTLAVGRRTVGSFGAAGGALLLAVCPFAIFYSTEARAYGLIMGLSVLSTFALLCAAEDGHRRWWVIYAVVSCACAYTHYTAVFVLAVQALWAFATYPRARRALMIANLAAVVGFVPWIPAVISNSRSFGTQVFGILEPFGAQAVGRDLTHWAVGHPFLTLSQLPGRSGAVLAALGLAIAVATAGIRLWRTDVPAHRMLRHPAALPLLLALALPVGLALYSSATTSVWDLRNLSASTPGLALTAGLMLSAAGRRAGVPALTLVASGLAVGAVAMLQPENQRPDYTAGARLIVRQGDARDPVAVVPAPTPGPLAAMDAALGYAGAARRPLLRIASPPLAAVLHSAPYAPLAATPPAELARQAIESGGARLFVVAPGAVPLGTLLRGDAVDTRAAFGPWFSSGVSGRLLATVEEPLSAFLRDVLPQFRPVGSRVLPGVLRISVYVLQRRR